MKHLSHRSILALFASVILVLTACQKKSDFDNLETTTSQGFVTEAKAWFANGPVSKENRLLSQPTSVLPLNAPQRIFARMGKMQKKLVWENAQHYNTEGLEYLVVPIDKKLTPYGSNYERASAIVFNKLPDGKMNMNVVEVLSKKNKSLNGKANEIIATAFINKEKNKNHPLSSLEASIFFYNEAYRNIGSYEITNGLLTPSRTVLNIKKNIANNIIANNLIETEGGTCETWYVVYDWRDEYGNLVAWEVLYSYQVGDCGNGPNGGNEEEFPEGQGGGGNENGVAIPPVTINVQHNCLKRAIFDLMGASNANSGIANLITSLFSTTYSSPYAYANLIVQQSNPPTQYSAWTTPVSSGNYTININPYFFNGQSIGGQLAAPTKEFWSSQFIHEIVHTFILEMGINQSIANNGFAQHELMITTWVNSISSLLQNMYGMSVADGNALALSGMHDVLQRSNSIAVATWSNYIQTKYQTSISAIMSIVADYMTGNKGTVSCN